ncbi:MAG TPA: DUF3618 domain-containing protein [Acidimicrobiales bacterium]|nr:DUF3618 domain-containing protein [Acidimicrobiales bacterium]
MGTRAEALRSEIARTRGDLSETLDAMGDRVSPRRMVERRTGRMRGRFATVREAVMGSPYQPGVTDRVGGAVRDATSSIGSTVGDAGGTLVEQAQQAPEMARRQVRGNPLAAGLIAFGGGLLLATVLPETDRERQAASAVSGSVRPIVEHAKHAAHEVASAVQDHAQQAAAEVKDHARDAAQQVQAEATEHGRQLGAETGDAARQVRHDATS